MTKSHGSGIFESHLLVAVESASRPHVRAISRNPCPAVLLLLASIQKIPQNLDAGQRSIRFDGILELLELYMHTFLDELQETLSILESSPNPLDHVTQIVSVVGYSLGILIASKFL